MQGSVRRTVVSYMYNFDVRNFNTNKCDNKNRTYATNEQYFGFKHRILIHEHEYENQIGKANVQVFTDRQNQYFKTYYMYQIRIRINALNSS